MERLVFTSTLNPTVDTAIYASGDLIGPKLSFVVDGARDSMGDMILESVLLVDQAIQSANMDLVLFSSDPSGTTFTDNAALDIADADMAKIVAVIPLTTHHTFADNSISRAVGLSIPLHIDPSAATLTLYGALVSRSTPDFVAATDVRVTLTFRVR